MPQHRYQPPSGAYRENETLPLDTQLTILTRQSTVKQSERNIFSAEMNPKDLVREGRRLGFEDIKVYDWDTGIGAYSTTIADRPALKHWLYELLPSGKSRALLVSQEDRLFRDRWETEHNAFIKQVAIHGGWVICGQRIYNFRRDMDCEQFRLACKYGKQYIEFHIKGRLQPALHRAAMAGRHTGGAVPWGYLVDYDPHSATYMHYQPYEPHVPLIVEHVFGAFTRLPQPSVMEIARQWDEAERVFPFFGSDIDSRRWRFLESHTQRDEALGGYRLRFRQAQRILTDVAYLGYRVRRGEIARDAKGQPRICHQPLVDADIFWWCFDRVVQERPAWAPPRSGPVVSTYRPHYSRTRYVGEVRFLAPGKVRCAVHGTRYAAVRENAGYVRLACSMQEGGHHGFKDYCPVAMAPAVDDVLVSTFLEHLRLDERDVQALATVAQKLQTRTVTGEREQLQQQLADERKHLEGAKQVALRAKDLADDMLEEMRRAKQAIGRLEVRIAGINVSEEPGAQAWDIAGRLSTIAARIRDTFPEWDRQSQSRVLSLALDQVVLGRVSRKVLGLWIGWRGGLVSRRELNTPMGQHLPWTSEEEAALRSYYSVLLPGALAAMLPGRTAGGIKRYALHLGLTRPRAAQLLSAPPIVVPASPVTNAMQAYGFPLICRDGSENQGATTEVSYHTSHRRAHPCSRGRYLLRQRAAWPAIPMTVAARCRSRR